MAKSRKTTERATADAVALMTDFPSGFAQLDQEHAQTVGRMAELQRLGLIYATTYWRRKTLADGQEVQFMYLHYPAKDGKDRQRIYVGSDQDKIEDALAGIERAGEYDRLANKKQQIEARIDRVQEALSRARSYLLEETTVPSWAGRYANHYRHANA